MNDKTGIEHQIAKAVEGEIDECYEYTGELMVFSLKDGRIMNILTDRSVVQLTDAEGKNTLAEYKIKITLE